MSRSSLATIQVELSPALSAAIEEIRDRLSSIELRLLEMENRHNEEDTRAMEESEYE